MKQPLLAISLMFLYLVSCKPPSQDSASSDENNNAWTLLIDGPSLDLWKGWKKDKPGSAWHVDNGVLTFDPEIKDRGDLLTRQQYENFEFHLDWKISDCGNSGLMYNVQEGEEYHVPYSTGPEMQILDNSCHPDAKIDKHRAGDLYDMKETAVVNVNRAGEWNTIIIKSKNGEVEFWQNGVKVVAFEMFTDEWSAMIENSKFKGWEGFGAFRKGHIALQDHGDKIWFRNIKIKTL